MRKLIAYAALVFLLGNAVRGQTQAACATVAANDSLLGIKTVPLWPDGAPQVKGNGCDDVPTLTEFHPQLGMGAGSAVVTFPGGGYQCLTSPMESREIAEWFTVETSIVGVPPWEQQRNTGKPK